MRFLPFLPFLAAPFLSLTENKSEQEMGPLVRIDAPEEATASMILLHGLGGSSDSFVRMARQYHSQERFKHINFILPSAPLRDTEAFHNQTLFPGVDIDTTIVHSWFNISEGGLEGGYDESEYWEITDYISKLIKNETAVHGIPPNRIVAGGFSQGDMVSTGALASIDTKIAGWLLFPTEIPVNLTQFDSRLVDVNKETPVFFGHGQDDRIIPVSDAIRTNNLFEGLGFNFNFHIYPGMDHESYFPANNRDVETWIEKIIPKE